MLGSGKERRKFYRHPLHVPIRLDLSGEPAAGSTESSDVSLGGLSFVWPDRLSKGAKLDVTISVKEKLFRIRSRVVYCRDSHGDGRFRTGVRFVDYPSAFLAKLAEEAIEILEYRKRLARETGRDVSEEEAARLWINRYGATFPDPD